MASISELYEQLARGGEQAIFANDKAAGYMNDANGLLVSGRDPSESGARDFYAGPASMVWQWFMQNDTRDTWEFVHYERFVELQKAYRAQGH